jgi:hypothetical protein
MKKLKAASFEEAVAQLVTASGGSEGPIPAAAAGLHICHACHSRLVYPMCWEEASDDSWQMALRCPNCGWSDIGRFEQTLVNELDRGDAELEADLARLTRANMIDEIDRFTRALDADAIQPFDF